MTIYLGIDPGRTTGMCWVSYRDKALVLHDFANIPWEHFMEWPRTWDTKFYDLSGFSDEKVIVVCEDYIHRKAAPWTPSPVTKQIGVCYGKAYDLGWHFALSQPYNKTAGYKLAKLNQTGHWQDSYAHVQFAIHSGLDPEQKIIW